jgi:hypothetical protein
MTPDDGDDLVRQLMSGDPAAAAAILAGATTSNEPLVLTAAALLDPADPDLLDRAAAAARRPRDRQVVALAAAHLAGDRDRLTALAREHLLDHPDSVIAAWIAAGAHPARAHTTTSSDGAAVTAPIRPEAGATPARTRQETS